MKRLLLLLAFLCGGYAERRDLSERVFTFPLDKGNSNVKLIADIQKPIIAMTVCLRYHSTLSRGQSLFSLATASESKELLLIKSSVGTFRIVIKGTALDVQGLPEDTDDWNSVCWTWDSTSGLAVVWLNGKRSARKLLKPHVTINGRPSIILGQEQGTYGGDFEVNKSFVGDIADVHFWDNVRPPCEIRFYMEGNTFTHGNLLNWQELQYNATGSVYVEKSDYDKLSCF